MTLISKEAMLFEVYTALSKALGKRIEPVACREDEFLLIIDKRWRLHLDGEDLEALHDTISSDGGAMRELFDEMKNSRLEFLSFQR